MSRRVMFAAVGGSLVRLSGIVAILLGGCLWGLGLLL